MSSSEKPAPRAEEDREIVRRVLEGDREAFRALVEKYQRHAYHAAWRVLRDPEEAEDAAQEAFLKAFVNLGRYDPRWAFSTWLTTIVTRVALSARRGRLVRPTTTGPFEIENIPAGSVHGPLRSATRNEWTGRLKNEVELLGRKMRTVFGLRYEDNLSIAEIADLTSSSESAVKVQLHRARKILRRKLREFSDLV